MTILVTGAKGQLGTDVCLELENREISYIPTDVDTLDITDDRAVQQFLLHHRPDAVIHCAAYTAVDKAEEEEALCTRINVEGTRHLAEACEQLGAKMLYLSTDYVFPGEGDMPYQPQDQPGPQSVYGKTKWLGEVALQDACSRSFVVRISWVFGVHGNNFVKTMLRLGRERGAVTVVCDQIGSPTFTPDLARFLCDLIQTEQYGIYHATNEGYCCWAQFAQAIFDYTGMNVPVTAVASSGYPSKAKRPLNSRLSKDCLDQAGFARLPRWEDALRRYLAAIGEAKP